MAKAKYVHFNGNIVPWDEAKIHLFSPVAKYGIGVFEGIRGYWNTDAHEMFLFRLKDHMDRLTYSQKVMRFDGLVDGLALADRTIELIHANEFKEAIHIRVQLYVDGEGDLSACGPVEVSITAVPRPLPKHCLEGITTQVRLVGPHFRSFNAGQGQMQCELSQWTSCNAPGKSGRIRCTYPSQSGRKSL